MDAYVNCIVQKCIPATEQHLDQAQEQDIICQQEYCHNGWPRKRSVRPEAALYCECLTDAIMLIKLTVAISGHGTACGQLHS